MVAAAVAGHTIPDTQPPPMVVLAVPDRVPVILRLYEFTKYDLLYYNNFYIPSVRL
jgi:hypothetical protein